MPNFKNDLDTEDLDSDNIDESVNKESDQEDNLEDTSQPEVSTQENSESTDKSLLESEIKDLKDKLLRALAENENTRKQSE